MKAPVPDVLVAKKSFVVTIDGKLHRFRKGVTHVAAGHPILKGREHLFEPAKIDVHYGVVTTAAEPGEERGIAPAKRTAPKKKAKPKKASRGSKK